MMRPGVASRAVPAERETAMTTDDKRLLEMPGHLIRRLHQISFALFLDQAKAFDMTPVQYAALVAIGSHPGIDQTALCNVVALDRTTIGGVVARLEKKRLIQRVNGLHDRRTKSLSITPEGRRLIRQIEPAVLATQRLILAPLKASERSAFMGMLKHLVHLNNEHSRAPLRAKETAGHRFRNVGQVKARGAVRAATRARARPD
jgi:DNA-binding MarR family transcriptional regulator